MRSESCSFIWQPNVVTWKRLHGVGGYRGSNCGIEGGAKPRLGLLMVAMRCTDNPRRSGWRAFASATTRSGRARSAPRAWARQRGDRSARRRAGGCIDAHRGVVHGRPHGAQRLWRVGSPPCWRCGARRGTEPPERRRAVGAASLARAASRRDRRPIRAGFGVPRRSCVHRSRRPIESTLHDGDPGHDARCGRWPTWPTALPRRPLEKAAEAAEALKLLNAPGARHDPSGARSGCVRCSTPTTSPRPRAARSRTRCSSCATTTASRARS